MEASNRPESPKQNNHFNKIQDGNTSECFNISKSRRMDDINRFKGCVLSHPNTSKVKKVSEICMGDSGPTVQGLMFRTLYSTTGIHENDGSNSSIMPSKRDQTPPLLGRLVNCSQVSSTSTSRHELGSSGNRKTRPNSEQTEIRPNSNTKISLLGDGNKHSTGEGISSPQKSGEIVRNSPTFQGIRHPISLGMASPDRSLSVTGKIGTMGKNASEIVAIPSQKPLVSRVRSKVDNGTDFGRSHSGPDLVDRSRESTNRGSVITSSTRCPTFYGRLESGLGGTFITSTGIRPMGPDGNKSTYKSIRTQSSEVRTSIISRLLPEQENFSHVRQLDSGSTHKESGGDPILDYVPENIRSPEMVIREQYNPHFSLHSGQEKRVSGPAQQEESSSSCRMVPTSRNLHKNMEDLGISSCGFICHKIQSQTSGLLLTGSGPISMGNRLHDNTMGQFIRLRISPSGISTQSPIKIDSVQEHQTNFNSPSLASTTLVRGNTISSSRPSQEVANLENSLETTSHKQVPPNSRGIPLSRVDVIERGIRARGFSKKAASCMARPNRKSTLTLYQAKWAQFCGWCRQRKTDPLSSTIPVIADFFIFLRENKKLSCSAIKGYRSALSQVFIHRGIDISSSPEISMLFRNFEQSIPPRTIPQPKWDLNIVLQSLIRAPFEPISAISLRNLTLKTVFLLALASAKRVSEIHGLSYLVAWAPDYSSATLDFTPDFVAKTQIPGDPSTAYSPITIPALSTSVGEDEPDNLLCPLRALKIYLNKTAASRPKCDKLFVSSVATFKHKPVTKNTISHWLRLVIKNAYNTIPKEDLQLWKISAHEVRAVATSLLFKHNHSLKEVMAAASWRSNSTFVSFYLRNINHQFLDIASVSSVVAAQSVIPSTSRTDHGQIDPQSNDVRKKKKKKGGSNSRGNKCHKRS